MIRTALVSYQKETLQQRVGKEEYGIESKNLLLYRLDGDTSDNMEFMDVVSKHWLKISLRLPKIKNFR